MSKLISNKEALIALANGEDVLFRDTSTGHVNHAKYQTAECIQNGYYDYRGERVYLEFFIKPRTITLNGIEVKPPKDVNVFNEKIVKLYCDSTEDALLMAAALRSVFKGV